MVDALREGVIDAIATDHAPHSTQDKAGGFADAAPGISCHRDRIRTADDVRLFTRDGWTCRPLLRG